MRDILYKIDARLFKSSGHAGKFVSYLTGKKASESALFILRLSSIAVGLSFISFGDLSESIFGVVFGTIIASVWFFLHSREAETVNKIISHFEEGRISLTVLLSIFFKGMRSRMTLLCIVLIELVFSFTLAEEGVQISSMFRAMSYATMLLGEYLLWDFNLPGRTLKKDLQEKLDARVPLPSPN